jgi:8-oxo-dGTP pyrophosphatase MutT (NUDIX family)
MQVKHSAVAWVLHNETKVLLILNNSLELWLPPGGKMDPGETPNQCAVRELREETGLIVNLNVYAKALPQPPRS